MAFSHLLSGQRAGEQVGRGHMELGNLMQLPHGAVLRHAGAGAGAEVARTGEV